MKFPEHISTDAVLLAFALHWSLIDFSHPDSPTRKKLMAVFSELRPADETGSEKIRPDDSDKFVQRMKELYREALNNSSMVAARIVSLTATLERFFKTVNDKDPKSIVAFFYCVIRTVQSHGQCDDLRKSATEQFGAYWMWPVVWSLVSENEVVKKRWEDEDVRGNLLDWMDDCQKYANNYWAARTKDFESMAVMEHEMISKLREWFKLE